MLEPVEVVGLFLFLFYSFIVVKSDFQVLACEERWMLMDFR